MIPAAVRILYCACFTFIVLGCQQGARETVLFDFEDESDLDRLVWNCRVQYSLSEEHATRGDHALKLSLYPSSYPGMATERFKRDWRDYDSLRMELFNPSAHPVQVGIRIDDKKKFPDDGDRFVQTYSISQGMNHLCIPLTALTTGGAARPLDLSNLYRIIVFMVRPQKAMALYLDNIRLIKVPHRPRARGDGC